MKPTFISREKNEVKLSLEFSGEEFESAITDAYRANKGKFLIDGFRKGKAPRSLIEARYGGDIFYEEAIDSMFSQNYPKALDELSLEVIDRPKVEFSEIKKEEGFTVTVTVEAYPEFEVKDYQNVEIDRIEAAVSDEDIDREIETMRKRNSRMIITDKPAAEGDTVLIDYEGYVGDKQFEGGTAERYPLKLGSNTFIPGFEEQLTGASAGDERDITVNFPDDYHSEELAGKEAVFKCKVHEIKEEELPELDDDFARDVSEFDTLLELRDDIKERLSKSASAKAENQMKNAAIEKVYNSNGIDAPDIMVEEELDVMLNEFGQQLRYQGMSLDKYFEYTNKDETEFKNEIREEAVRKVRTRMLITKIAEQEKLEASEDEIEKEMELIAASYKMELAKVKELMGGERAAMIERDIKMRKAVDWVFDNAKIK